MRKFIGLGLGLALLLPISSQAISLIEQNKLPVCAGDNLEICGGPEFGSEALVVDAPNPTSCVSAPLDDAKYLTRCTRTSDGWKATNGAYKGVPKAVDSATTMELYTDQTTEQFYVSKDVSPIVSFGSCTWGARIQLQFVGDDIVITHGADINLPGAADITANLFDTLGAHCGSSNNWFVDWFTPHTTAPGTITDSSAGTFTNKIINAEGTGNVITIPVTTWFGAAMCQNVTAISSMSLPTSDAAAAACVTGTNTQKGVLDFDKTTSESAQFSYMLPSDWTGAVDFKFSWFAAEITGSAAWCAQLICVADAETDDPAFPAQAVGNCVSDVAKGTTLQVNDAALTGATATGCAAGELMHVKISRDPDEVSTRTDTIDGDVSLIGVEMTLRRAM